LSGGKMDLRKLMDELRKKYGKERYFEDDGLFDVITAMTYPEIRDFFAKYVEGGEPIPYEYYFGLAGVKFSPPTMVNGFGLGRPGITVNGDNHLVVVDTSGMNPLGKKMGYQIDDVIYSVNGMDIGPENFNEVKKTIGDKIKEGDPLELKIGRKNAGGVMEAKTLKTEFIPMPVRVDGKLELLHDPTPEQAAVRKAWLELGN
jgi:predicted metalloprotease with PDZ domain